MRAILCPLCKRPTLVRFAPPCDRCRAKLRADTPAMAFARMVVTRLVAELGVQGAHEAIDEAAAELEAEGWKP